MKSDNTISGIHNWCDRWCERCSFVARCSVGAIELKRWKKGKDWTSEDYFAELEKMFEGVEDKMAERMEELGIDWEEVMNEPLPEPDPKAEAQQKAMRERGMRYYRAVNAFLKENEPSFKAKGIDLFGERDEPVGPYPDDRSELADAVDVIRWYLHFQFVKAERAIHGMEDMYEDYWDGPQQSDANGSAKIAMIAAGRSIGAWEVLRHYLPEKSREITEFQAQIEQFRRIMERLFPDWRKFVRPGFDTEPPSFGRLEPN